MDGTIRLHTKVKFEFAGSILVGEVIHNFKMSGLPYVMILDEQGYKYPIKTYTIEKI